MRTLLVETTRFGTIEVPEEKVIAFPQGLLGFPGLRRYVLLDHKETPLKWLQAVDDPAVAFIVAEPQVVGTGWDVTLGADVREFLSAGQGDQIVIFLILRVEEGKVVANLEGPLAINGRLRVGVQAVLGGV